MITDELVSYIETQLKKNTPREIITSRLLQAGWNPLDVEEGFLAIAPASSVPLPARQASASTDTVVHTDPYRESPQIKTTPPLEQKESPKVWIPTQVKPIEQEISTPQTESASVDIRDTVSPLIGEVSSSPKFQSKVYVYVIPTEDATATEAANVIKEDLLPALAPKELQAGHEDSPQAISSPVVTESHAVNPPVRNDISAGKSVQGFQAQPGDFASSVVMADTLLKTENKKHSWKNTFLILVIFAIGAFVFALSAGYIPPSLFQFSLIKKDPKDLLVSASAILAKHESYKTATNLTISSPLFSDITSGLLTGEPVASSDRDSISFTMLRTVQNEPESISRSVVSTKSSIFPTVIQAEIISARDLQYFIFPDLSQFFPSADARSGSVTVPDGDLSTLIHELPLVFGVSVEESDRGQILSKGVSPSMKAEIKDAFKELVAEISVNEKTPEKIRDVETYHYNINVDRPTMKKFLTRIFLASGVEFSAKAKPLIEEALGSVSVNSFEVWVGKASGTIAQYKIVLSTPLSKVLGLNDNGIAGNEVMLELQTTFYDFDIPTNTITIPENATPLPLFIQTVRDFKIKSILTSFQTQAKNLQKIEGRYGVKANTSGSCASPTNGSLFSPLGHTSKASTPVGAIAQSMNILLGSATHPPVCHSNASSWMVAVPLVSDPNAIFCSDSTGALKTLQAMPNGTSCK